MSKFGSILEHNYGFVVTPTDSFNSNVKDLPAGLIGVTTVFGGCGTEVFCDGCTMVFWGDNIIFLLVLDDKTLHDVIDIMPIMIATEIIITITGFLFIERYLHDFFPYKHDVDIEIKILCR